MITYTIETLEEYDGPDGAFASGDEEADKRMVAQIKEDYNSGNPWAWCCVKVTASVEYLGETFKGWTTLGACSYANEADFKAEGYYAELCLEARKDLMVSLRKLTLCGEKAGEVLDLLDEESLELMKEFNAILSQS